MSFGQVQLVKWSFPAVALIIGLLWYKRRRADRVDPGGQPKLKADSNGSTPTANGILCDSGIHTDDSFSMNASASTPVDEIISPRKVSESLDIPNRRSSSQSIPIMSCKSIELNNTSWYDESEDSSDIKEIQLGSNPSSSGFDYMTKSKSAEQIKSNSKNSSIMEDVIEEETKVVVANNNEEETKIVVANNKVEETKDVVANNNVEETKDVVANNKEEETKDIVANNNEDETKVVVANNNEVNAEKTESKSCDDKPAAIVESPHADDKKRLALCERDSANHSPVSGVLDGSVNDEARSEGSTDSGKGGSINGHGIKDPIRTTYEFAVPTKWVGKLIGKGGRFLTQIRKQADVSIIVKYHPLDQDSNICRIDGAPENIALALEQIRRSFPEKAYPSLTLEPISYEGYVPEEMSWLPELMQLSLIEGVNNDVIVSHIVQPNHFFVQLPTHPTFPSLRILDDKMTQLYETVDSPPVPDELSKGMIVVAKWFNRWVRVSIENADPNGEQTLARMVDHGGYWMFHNAEMRKIRSDFLALPFQAIEVFIANIEPKDGEWSQESFDIVAQICSGTVGQAQIIGYLDSSVFINLYFNFHKHGVISLADELIARGLAVPAPFENIVPQELLLTT